MNITELETILRVRTDRETYIFAAAEDLDDAVEAYAVEREKYEEAKKA